eukprot:29647_3
MLQFPLARMLVLTNFWFERLDHKVPLHCRKRLVRARVPGFENFLRVRTFGCLL